MTEYDVNQSTIGDFMVSMFLYWIIFAVVVYMACKAWPYIVKAYWSLAWAYYWACRKCIKNTRGHNRSLYTGYYNKESN